MGVHPITDAHGKDDGNTCAAIFGPNGDVIVKLGVESSGVDPQSGKYSGPPEQPATAEGELFYRTTKSGKNLVVMDTAGSIVHQLRLSGARPGDRVIGLTISDNLALLTYVNFSATPQQSYVLLNATTGDRYGFYLPPVDLQHGGLTCFDRSRGLTFLSSTKGHLSSLQSALP